MLVGAGVSVSGQGAWARLSGTQTFTVRTLERSQNFQQLKTSQNIGGGIFAFFSWLGIGVNASTNREEITGALQEIVNNATVQGSISYALFVTGLFPNVQVDASAFIYALQVTDNQGSTATVLSSTAPGRDAGAQDTNGNKLPSSDDGTTITIPP